LNDKPPVSGYNDAYCKVSICCGIFALYTAISIKVVGSFQAYATRPKGSVGSCKCLSFTVVSSWLGTSVFLVQVIIGHHPIIVSGNLDSAFHFQLLVLVMMWENSCLIFFHDAAFPTSNLHTNAHAPRAPTEFKFAVQKDQ